MAGAKAPCQRPLPKSESGASVATKQGEREKRREGGRNCGGWEGKGQAGDLGLRGPVPGSGHLSSVRKMKATIGL